MKRYDITQEVFGCRVYPGDPSPKKEELASMAKGDLYNLTAFSMCAHNGTHIDAPRHFIADGKTVDEISHERMIGICYLAEHEGIVTKEAAEAILEKAAKCHPEAAKRILVKGNATLSYEGAEVFAKAGVFLYGNESQTVGPEEAPLKVHVLLLTNEVVLLEGVRLSHVPCGVYYLFAAPLLLGGADGAPCRAFLVQDEFLLHGKELLR